MCGHAGLKGDANAAFHVLVGPWDPFLCKASYIPQGSLAVTALENVSPVTLPLLCQTSGKEGITLLRAGTIFFFLCVCPGTMQVVTGLPYDKRSNIHPSISAFITPSFHHWHLPSHPEAAWRGA